MFKSKKNKFLIIISAVFLLLTLALPASAGTFKLNTAIFTIGSTSYTFNGQTRTMDVAPVIVPPGRTMLPIRYFAYGTGIPESDVVYKARSTAPGYSQDQEVDIYEKVDQDGFNYTNPIQILYDSANLQEAVMVLNHSYANPISFVKQYGAVPEIINGRLMLPLRAVELIPASAITWNGNTRQVTVQSPETSG